MNFFLNDGVVHKNKRRIYQRMDLSEKQSSNIFTKRSRKKKTIVCILLIDKNANSSYERKSNHIFME